MAEIITDNIKWKKGEEGLQHFILFESDGVTRRNGTGKTYSFSFWKHRDTVLKGTGTLVPTDITNGEYDYTVISTDTDTIEEYIGELIEDPSTTKLKSNTFKVDVEESSDFT